MQRLLPLLLFALVLTPARAQDGPVLPGDARLDASRVQPGEAAYTITIIQGTVRQDIGTLRTTTTIDEDEGVITVIRAMDMMGQKLADTTRADWPALTARSHSSDNMQRHLRFTVEDGTLAGEHTPRGGEPEAFAMSLDGPVFDSAWIGMLASMLPLDEGYTAVIPAYEYEVDGLAEYTVAVQGREEIQLAPGAKMTAWVVEAGREGSPAVRFYLDPDDFTMKQMRVSPQPGLDVLITAQTEGGGGK